MDWFSWWIGLVDGLALSIVIGEIASARERARIHWLRTAARGWMGDASEDQAAGTELWPWREE